MYVDGDVARHQGRSFMENNYKKPAAAVEEDLVCQFGSPDEVLERIDGYARLGVRTVIIRFASADQLDQLETCSKEILPCL
ncbi:hypothetical protein NKDENANG_04130 [Candidatus Entotheonellaceae bacterium PAL068K]